MVASSKVPGTFIDVNTPRDTAWFIFKKLFQCRIPYIQTLSLDYIRLFGMPSSGDPIYDKQTANELVTKMLPISAMAEFFGNGVNILLVKYTDAKIIYEHITDHLNFWKEHLQSSLNVGGAPIDDLILLDKFAMSVYAHAKYQFTTEMVDSILARRMSTAMRVNRSNILRKKPDNAVVINSDDNKEEDPFPKRESMAQTFANLSPTRHRWK